MPVRQAIRGAIPPRIDVVLTIVLAVFVVMGTSAIAHWHHSAGPHGVGFAWLIGGALPLLWRRRYPVTVFGACCVLVGSYDLSGLPAGPNAILTAVALVSLAYFRGPVIGGLGAAVLLAAFVIAISIQRGRFDITDPRPLGALVGMTAMVAIGTAMRTRRAVILASRERALERERRRTEEQRLRIAREVHDVVAHSLAMINVQAGVGAHVADRRPEQAKEALLAIKAASRTALADLRATLTVLRTGQDLAPTPSLRRLDELVEAASAAGLEVVVRGQVDDVPAPVDVAVYRILQESLTNVVRHAGGASTVWIDFELTDEELGVTVRDNGAGAAAETANGNGLRGMAERAQALGGTLTTGPGRTGGFEVRVRLPLDGGGGG